MTTASAPSQLPFAPRPFTNEFFSSWMLRIADANCVSLQELMLGLQCRHPDLPFPDSLDWGFPPAFLTVLARFCRTSMGPLHCLDLRPCLLSDLHLASTLCVRPLGMDLPCPAPLSCSQEPAPTRLSHVWRRRPSAFRLSSGRRAGPLLELRSKLDQHPLWLSCPAG